LREPEKSAPLSISYARGDKAYPTKETDRSAKYIDEGVLKMKKISIMLVVIGILTAAGIVYADDQESWSGYNYCPYCGSYMGQGGYGMGPGMMGQGMMSRGMGGQGMGPGMMGQGMMGRGMMGRGSQSQSPECQKFFDETAGLRKELHTKRFEYFEAARNPKTTGEALTKIEKEVRELQEKIYAKGPIGCWQ
jgi:hypothetical protein